MSYNTVFGALCCQKKMGSTICWGSHWAIPENIHYTTDGFLEFWVQGGFFEMKIWRHGGILIIGILRAWGIFRPGISTGTDRSVFLENTYFMDFISLQIKHELTTLLTTAEVGHKMPSKFFKLVGLGVTADPEGSNSRWQKCKYTQTRWNVRPQK